MRNFINKYPISIILLVFITILFITKYYQSFIQTPQNKATTFSGRIIPLNYTNSTLLNTFNKKNIDEYQTAAGTYDIQTIASEVTSTMLAAFKNTPKRTLPLVANWNVGIPEYSDGLDPLYLIDRFTYGEHLVPTWKLDPYYNDNIGLSYYQTSIKKAAALGLPLVFILPSPESALTQDDVYFNMDKTQNPNVITVNGTVLPELSPFGPDSLWNEVGEQWSTTTLMAQLQEWYPNPPLVVFIDEDASKKLSWSKLATSSKYIEKYPTNTSNEFKRTLVNAKWLEKYRQLHEGFKQGFTQKAWKQNVKFVTRNQLAVNMGATADWINSATTTNQYANIWPLTADGLTINFNLDGDKTDTTNAPHRLLNNLPFMLEEAKELNQNFTYQLSIDANQKIDNPQRYRGFTQFALWFLRPSIIRQTPNKTTKDEINPLFQQVVDSVELIHNSDVLADFWKNGKLVSTGSSSYNQNIPTNYQSVPREFLLKTDTTSPVWAFALEKGVTPNREWLVYVQSPEENLTNITVTIPNFENVSLDSIQEGNFYTINENNSKVFLTNIQTNSNTSGTKAFNTNITLGNGTTYYFDAQNGNNSSDGLTPTTAFKTLSKLNKIHLFPGDNILLKCNSIFTESLTLNNIHGTNDANITITSYETGSQPIINIIQQVPKDTIWTQYNSNIWMTSTILYNPQRILYNSRELLRANKLSELDGKKFFWFYDNTKLYLYMDSKPDNNILKMSNGGKALLVYQASYIHINNINIIGGYDASLAINSSSNINITNITTGKYARGGIKILNSNAITVTHSIIDSFFSFNYSDALIYKGTTDRGPANGIYIVENVSDSNISNNMIKNWCHASIDIFADFQNSSYEIKHNIISYNYLTSPDIPYGGRMAIDGNSHNNEIYNNTIHNIYASNQINGYKNHFYNNFINGVHNSPLKKSHIGRGIALEGYAGPVTNNFIEKNIIMNTDAEGLYIARMSNYTINNNIVDNNIFYNCGLVDKVSIVIGYWNAGDGTTYNNKIINNILYNENNTTKKLIIQNGQLLDVQTFNGLFTNTAIASNNKEEKPILSFPKNIN